MNLDQLQELNKTVVSIIKPINLIEAVGWDAKMEGEFLSSFEKGQPVLPTPYYQKIDLSDCRLELDALAKKLSRDNPIEIYTKKTINSYIDAIRLIESRNTPAFQKLSVEMFGRPNSIIPGGRITNIEAAQKLLDVAHRFEHPYLQEPEACITAASIAEDIRKSCKIFGPDRPDVQIVENLSAKATASMTTVKLRAGTCFTKYDTKQLIVHEVMVHCLTSINGAKQPFLKLMASSAPRTTSTQEGLATFSEVVTGAIDLNRLSRIALRIIAIDRCLSGANFLETFEFFRDNGQSMKESFWSAARIFRGGDPKGGIVFTKDSVYLDGLLHIHALFQWALVENRQSLIHLLFCGKVAFDDIFLLEEALNSGDIAHPAYIPNWYRNIESLAGSLAFSMLNTMIDMNSLKQEFAEHEKS